MEKEVLIEVKGLSKKFSRSLKRSMWYGLKEVFNSMLRIKGDKSHLHKQEFWALRDINFEVRRGECLGLIGHNGAGKSTLLKILNGLIRPDEGSVTIRGKVGALIELGAGFNPLLTGRENIFVNGQLLGFTKDEIDQKLKSILDFADIGDFIDAPVQNYSSGMKVRLGFAIAAQMEPDVLIIDEVLSVGDLGFVLKCFSAIDTMMRNTAVIFVSHSMPQVSRICSDIMLLEKGKSLFMGSDISTGIDLYYSKFANKKANAAIFGKEDDVALINVHIGEKQDLENEEVYQLNHLEDLPIDIEIRVNSKFANPSVAITVADKEQRNIGVCLNEKGFTEKNILRKEDGFTFYRFQLILPRINLSKGVYSITLSVLESFRSRPLLRLQSIAYFQVKSKYDVWEPVEFEGKWL